jgi:NDP-sugar pyrophosphorylase family protein
MIYKKSWKYILKHTFESYYRLKAVKDFSDVKKGELGGYVKGYYNLSQEGNCWVYNTARINKRAIVTGNAIIKNKATVTGNAIVSGRAVISGNAIISGDDVVSGDIEINNRNDI